jgi:hypothetical protein
MRHAGVGESQSLPLDLLRGRLPTGDRIWDRFEQLRCWPDDVAEREFGIAPVQDDRLTGRGSTHLKRVRHGREVYKRERHLVGANDKLKLMASTQTENRVHVNVFLEPGLLQALDRKAEESDRTRSAEIRQALKGHVERERRASSREDRRTISEAMRAS